MSSIADSPNGTRRHLVFGTLLATGLSLTGCASLPSQSSHHMVYSGRFNARTATQNNTGRYTLTQDIDRNEIRLTILTPLGTLAGRIIVTPTESRLEMGTGTTYRASSPESLMQGLLGFSLPLEAMLAWLDGHSYTKTPNNMIGNTLHFQELGWSVTRTENTTANTSNRLTLENLTTPTTRLTLTVDATTGTN